MNNELYHHGILGQKWGVRRFQNKDGSLTSAGRNRVKQVDSNNAMREAKRQKVRDLKNKRNMSDAELANKIKFCDNITTQKIKEIITDAGFNENTNLKVKPIKILDIMKKDKKSVSKKIRFVLPKKIGVAKSGIELDDGIILNTIKDFIK